MTKEQAFFLEVLADHFNQRPTNPPAGLDWDQLISYATRHQLQGILWHQCRTFLFGLEEYQDLYKSLQMTAMASQYNYANKAYAFQELGSCLKDHHIGFFAVKGLEVAALYPIPCYRTMGDLDIVVAEKDKEDIRSLVGKLGYQLIAHDFEMVCQKQYITIEIHDHLVYKQNQEFPIIKDFFDKCWDYVREDENGNTVLDWNYHFAFLVEHLKKHFGGNGIGFRQFMDLAVVCEKVHELDWKKIEEYLRKIGLWDFALTALAFCQRWFDFVLPTATREIDDAFYQESTELVFNNGVFGFNNAHHREHSIERRLRASSLPRSLSKIKLVLKEVFISYKYMIQLPYCSFLIGKKALLPFAWLYRIYYVVTKKKALLDSKRRLLFNSDEELLRHHKLMRKWGL